MGLGEWKNDGTKYIEEGSEEFAYIYDSEMLNEYSNLMVKEYAEIINC